MTKARNIANLASDGSALADGTINYTDITGTPAPFDPDTLAAVAVSGAYADVTGTPAAALPLAGGTLTGNVNLGDNVKANFGAGSDLEIYHDGSDSFIKDKGTGNLVLTSNGGGIFFRNDAETETYANFNNNGSVQLRYDNAAKLETSATGVTVTGGAALSGGLTGVTSVDATTAASITAAGVGGAGSAHLGRYALTDGANSVTISSLNLTDYKMLAVFFDEPRMVNTDSLRINGVYIGYFGGNARVQGVSYQALASTTGKISYNNLLDNNVNEYQSSTTWATTATTSLVFSCQTGSNTFSGGGSVDIFAFA